jgi:hypothetical protein
MRGGIHGLEIAENRVGYFGKFYMKFRKIKPKTGCPALLLAGISIYGAGIANGGELPQGLGA